MRERLGVSVLRDFATTDKGPERERERVGVSVLRDFATTDKGPEREERVRESERDESYGGWEGNDVSGTRNEQGVEL